MHGIVLKKKKVAFSDIFQVIRYENKKWYRNLCRDGRFICEE